MQVFSYLFLFLLSIEAFSNSKLKIDFSSTFLVGPQHVILKTSDNKLFKTTLEPDLQLSLQKLVENSKAKVAIISLVDAKTGNFLALSTYVAKNLHQFKLHPLLYKGFRAASLFKTVSSIAALEIFSWDSNKKISIRGFLFSY